MFSDPIPVSKVDLKAVNCGIKAFKADNGILLTLAEKKTMFLIQLVRSKDRENVVLPFVHDLDLADDGPSGSVRGRGR